MKNSLGKISFLLLTASVALNTACSSGGGDTAAVTPIINTTAAKINDTNAEAIGLASGEAVRIATADLPTGITVDNNTSADLTRINNILIPVAHSKANTLTLPTGIDVSAEACSSGSASVSMTPENATSGPVTMTMILSNCTLIDVNITATGTVEIHYNDIADFNTGFTIKYINFTVIDTDGTKTTMNASMVCDDKGCTFNSEFVGSDGITHSVSEINFTSTSPFNGTATFIHGTYGSVSITVTDITYGSCGSYPDAGSIAFSSTNGSSGTIIFNSDCTVSGTWDNGTTSGSF